MKVSSEFVKIMNSISYHCVRILSLSVLINENADLLRKLF